MDFCILLEQETESRRKESIMKTLFQHKNEIIRKSLLAKINAMEKQERQKLLKRQDAFSDETHQDFESMFNELDKSDEKE